MKFNFTLALIGISVAFVSCESRPDALPLVGTWELISATATEKDSTFSTFNPKQKMIKIMVQLHGDTVIQKGDEKVEKLGIDRIIVEKYRRVTSE